MWRPAAAALAVLLSCALPAGAQRQPNTQGGTVNPGDVAKFQGNGMTTGAGGLLGDNTGKGVNPFSIYDRSDKGLCFHTAPSSQADVVFCLGHDTSGNALLSLDSRGGAAAKQLLCSINGITGACFSAPVVTPPPPIPDGSHLAINAGGGLLLNAGGFLLLN